jgi:protocatechuate 3,4-dioxygenase beta subunit
MRQRYAHRPNRGGELDDVELHNDLDHDDIIDDNDDGLERKLCHHAERDRRALSVVDRPVSHRYPRERGRNALTLTLRVVAVNRNCAAVTNANVEIWHCDVARNYSQYGSSAGQTFLRGIQTTNANGEVTFTTIYPGWYQGRATHIHIEVTINNASVKVTQLAFPESVNNIVHTQGVDAGRGRNMHRKWGTDPTQPR